MKRIDKAKVKTMVEVVKEFEKAYGEMPIPTWNQIHFYNTAFHELVKVIEDDLGEKLCN